MRLVPRRDRVATGNARKTRTRNESVAIIFDRVSSGQQLTVNCPPSPRSINCRGIDRHITDREGVDRKGFPRDRRGRAASSCPDSRPRSQALDRVALALISDRSGTMCFAFMVTSFCPHTNEVAQFESGPSALLYMRMRWCGAPSDRARALRPLDVAVRKLQGQVRRRVQESGRCRIEARPIEIVTIFVRFAPR